MNNYRICFIICTNDERYREECEFYLKKLQVPEGYSIDIQWIYGAKSMAAGYNEGMSRTDAKYKIYIHQDVFVIHQNMLYELLELFQDTSIGMIGMVGSKQFPEVIVPWYGERVGKIYTSNVIQSGVCEMGISDKPYTRVQGIDGLFMATQYDVVWREDLFTGWDFYDLSQSQEMIRAGYKVIVPDMSLPWVIHDDGFLNLEHYDQYRRIFQQEYLG